jgi:hypothetical protein
MKQLFLVVSLFFIVVCRGQEKKSKNNKNMTMVDSISEKIDLLKFGKPFPQGNVPPYDTRFDVSYNDTLQDGSIINGFGTIDSDFTQEILPKKGWFAIRKDFYGNKMIKEKGLYNKTVSGKKQKIGKWYEFDEQGKVIKTTDYDKNYKMSFHQITEIAHKYARKYDYDAKTGINDVINNHIWWNEDFAVIKRDQGIWDIYFSKPHFKNEESKKCERLHIKVDDKTQKIVKEDHYFEHWNISFPPSEERKEESKPPFRTYKGKNYTQEEWKVFEEEEYQKHLKKKK